MFGLHRSLPVFKPPPCMCAEIEEHVREAIAMRDEMAKWDTPLREWAKLQQMPVLRLKSEQVSAPPPIVAEPPPEPALTPPPLWREPPPPAKRTATRNIYSQKSFGPVVLKGGDLTIRTLEPPKYEDGTYNFIFLTASVPSADLGVQVQCRGVTYYITSMSLLDGPVGQQKVMLRTMRVY